MGLNEWVVVDTKNVELSEIFCGVLGYLLRTWMGLIHRTVGIQLCPAGRISAYNREAVNGSIICFIILMYLCTLLATHYAVLELRQ